jgi:cation transport regulator ChaC
MLRYDGPLKGDLWIFGYGSLMWRPDFSFAERCPGFITGWARRFWQGSTDHRGVPEAPGRVVTLTEAPGGRCWGVAYRVDPEERDAVLEDLDHRERGGFDRREVVVRLRQPRFDSIRAITYVATSANPNYLGPASLASIAEQVRRSRGPSGSNVEYAQRLAQSLRVLEIDDDHVFELVALL